MARVSSTWQVLREVLTSSWLQALEIGSENPVLDSSSRAASISQKDRGLERRTRESYNLGRAGLLGKGSSPCLKPHREFQPMELEAEEQNKTHIVKFGEGSWNRTSSKAGFHLSFLSSFCKYSRTVSCVPHTRLGTHTSMNELLS